MSKIKFITDSAADIPAGLAEELGITVLHFPIIIEGQEYRDGVDFTAMEFYEKLLELPEIPTHAQLNPIVFTEEYEKAYSEGYTDVIYTCINAKGSATYGNSVAAATSFFEEHPEARGKMDIHTIDSQEYTMAYGYAVVEGARMAAQGKDAKEVLDFMNDWLRHVKISFGMYDLKFAKKSGRVSAVAAFVGELMGLKPITTFLDGSSKVLSKVRGADNLIPGVLSECKKDMEPGTPYICISARLEDRNREIVEKCTAEFGYPPLMTYFIGGVISINAGPDLTGIIYRKKLED